jgi:hypothetical protein
MQAQKALILPGSASLILVDLERVPTPKLVMQPSTTL